MFGNFTFQKFSVGAIILAPLLSILFSIDRSLLEKIPTSTLIILCIIYSVIGSFLVVITYILLPRLLVVLYLYLVNWVTLKETSALEAELDRTTARIKSATISMKTISSEELRVSLKQIKKQHSLGMKKNKNIKADILASQSAIKITMDKLIKDSFKEDALKVAALIFMIANLFPVIFSTLGFIEINEYKDILIVLFIQFTQYFLMSISIAYYLLRKFCKGIKKPRILPLCLIQRYSFVVIFKKIA